MERNDPPHDAGSDPTSGPTDDDALRRLEERIDRASDAAERLIAEAAAQAAASAGARIPSRPPPAGWQAHHASSDAGRGPGEVELLAQVLKSLRELIPPDLQHRLAEALREVLVALRALINWYLDHAERQRTEPSKVQDIPIT